MLRRRATPDRLFDRPWSRGHPFCRRTGRLRRWSMFVLFVLLSGTIGGYVYLTDAERVRGMAEAYLAQLVGGRVSVGGATLSVFEGLRLDDVRISVDHRDDPDSLLLSAQTFVIKYHPRSMLAGRLEATQIVAQKPQVHLSENLDTGAWNVNRLGASRARRPRTDLGPPKPPPALPEILLRNARVEISEIRNGRHATLGHMSIDGQLTPAAGGPGRYSFEIQSRGVSEGVGPFASGSVNTGTGEVHARLMNFEFGRDVFSVLPTLVRRFFYLHEVAGRVDIPVFSYAPPREGRAAQFRVETDLNGVTLAVPPEEWLSAAEGRRLEDTRGAVAMMQELHGLAGHRVKDLATARLPASGVHERALAAGDDDPFGSRVETIRPLAETAGPDRLGALLRRFPVRLHSVAGRFVFTQDGIEIRDVSGRVENNGLKIRGRIYGYRPDARAAIRVTSFDTENLIIPAAPRYVNSLPPQVREIYDQLRPQGTGRLTIDLTRPEPGVRPVVSGQLDILDGQFVYDKFPYPLRNATGRVLFGRDPETGLDRVAIQRLRGRGIEGGPNRDTWITVEGRIEPLGPTAGVNITIHGENVHSEEALRQAFPREVRDALKVFDANETGRFPTFRGAFTCNVVRPLGYRTPWSFDTDVKLDDAAGVLSAFPYPMKGVTGELKIRSGYVDIVRAGMARADGATMDVSGRVAWGRGRSQESGVRGQESGVSGPDSRDVSGASDVPRAPPSSANETTAITGAERDPFKLPDAYRPRTSIKVTVRKLPIDPDLLAALPADRRAWLERAKVAGAIDIDGRIFEAEETPAPDAPVATGTGPRMRPLDYEFGIAVHDGVVRPLGGDFELTRVAGNLRLTPKQLTLDKVVGHREGATVGIDGTIDWSQRGVPPVADLAVRSENLLLDRQLYAVLPSAGQQGWDEVRPAGRVDADMTYRGTLRETNAARPSDAAADEHDAPPDVRTVIRPRQIAANLKSVPYPLEKLTGTVTVERDTVRLDNLRAEHGKATVALSGVGTFAATGSSNWDLKLAAANVPADDEFRAALPTALAELIESLELRGTIGLDFSKLSYRGGSPASTAVASASDDVVPTVSLNDAAAPTAGAKPPDPEIDLVVAVSVADGSLDAGVPLTRVNGTLALEASVRDGRLAELSGTIDAPALNMADRPVKQFRAALVKPRDKSELRLQKMQGELAGGELAGGVTVVYPDEGASRYSAELIVRGADVRELVGEVDEKSDLNGRLTASLSLEGGWGDPTARRGRGDVVVSGREMYRIPLLLGLSQVTNLTVPVSSPFNEATARYSLQGQHVAFEEIELRASNMLMTGEGHLDFETKKVDLTFVTDNPGGLKVPFLNDIFQGARQELLKVHVRGTVAEPKVSAGVMGTFTTTVDEVFKGEGPATRKKKRAP